MEVKIFVAILVFLVFMSGCVEDQRVAPKITIMTTSTTIATTTTSTTTTITTTTTTTIPPREIYFEDTFVELNIPNAFTPNGDEVNDTWSIGNLNRYASYEIAVYSRTGLLVYKSTSHINEWDGRYNGEFVPVGNYYYLINIHEFQKAYTGTILVLK